MSTSNDPRRSSTPEPRITGNGLNLYNICTDLLNRLDDVIMPDIRAFLKEQDDNHVPVSERDQVIRNHTDYAMQFMIDLLRELRTMFKEGYIPIGELPADEDLLYAHKYFMDNLAEFKYYDDPRWQFHGAVYHFFDECLSEKYNITRVRDHFFIRPKPLSETRAAAERQTLEDDSNWI